MRPSRLRERRMAALDLRFAWSPLLLSLELHARAVTVFALPRAESVTIVAMPAKARLPRLSFVGHCSALAASRAARSTASA